MPPVPVPPVPVPPVPPPASEFTVIEVGGGVPEPELGFWDPTLAAAVIAVEIWVVVAGVFVVFPWFTALITAVATVLAWVGELEVTAEATMVAAWVTPAVLCPTLFWT